MNESVFKALHAIQLESIETRELYIKVNGELDRDYKELFRSELKLGSAHSDFDSERKVIHVGLRLSLGMEKDNELPISMRIEVLGTFSVNTDEFSEEHLDDWADNNAPLILFPFIREHGYALTTRCGLPPAILPLIQVPTLTKKKIEDKSS